MANPGSINIPIPHSQNPNTNAPSDVHASVIWFGDDGLSFHVVRNLPVLYGAGYHEVMEELVNSGKIHARGTHFIYQTIDDFARGQLMTVSEENGALVVKPGLPDAPSIPRLTCWPPKVRR